MLREEIREERGMESTEVIATSGGEIRGKILKEKTKEVYTRTGEQISEVQCGNEIRDGQCCGRSCGSDSACNGNDAAGPRHCCATDCDFDGICEGGIESAFSEKRPGDIPGRFCFFWRCAEGTMYRAPT